jgi:hypothetical protein
VTVQLATAASAYFAWKHLHPHECEEPSAIWGAAWRAGACAAMHDSARFCELVPLLHQLLALLEDERVEREVRDSDRRPIYDDTDDCEVTW